MIWAVRLTIIWINEIVVIIAARRLVVRMLVRVCAGHGCYAPPIAGVLYIGTMFLVY